MTKKEQQIIKRINATRTDCRCNYKGFLPLFAIVSAFWAIVIIITSIFCFYV